MAERQEYELTEEELQSLLVASQITPHVMIGGRWMPSAQENANRAWQALAREKGFIWDTVKPVPEKSTRYFTAEPS